MRYSDGYGCFAFRHPRHGLRGWRLHGHPDDWAKQMFGYTVEVVKRNEQHLSKVLPKRWIVERTFAWLNWSRRLSKTTNYAIPPPKP